MDLQKDLSDSQIVLMVIPCATYNDATVEVMKQLLGKNVCYVTLNKTYHALKEQFEEKGIDLANVFFIDVISKTTKSLPDMIDNCYFISSPSALTDISIAITTVLEQLNEVENEQSYLIFDSLTTMMIYQKEESMIKFIQSLIMQIKTTKIKSLFYTLDSEEQKDIIKQVQMLVDRVAYWDGGGPKQE